MKKDFIELVSLFDIYGNLLSENEYKAFEMYYCEDFSLSEISENLGITRQGVRDNIVRAEKILRQSDEKLGFKKSFSEIRKKLDEAKDCLNSYEKNKSDESIDMLKSILNDIDI